MTDYNQEFHLVLHELDKESLASYTLNSGQLIACNAEGNLLLFRLGKELIHVQLGAWFEDNYEIEILTTAP